MGLAMANNLQRHLVAKRAPAMLYNNRRLGRGKQLQELGGVPTKSFENVVRDCGIIFTMVLSPFLPRCYISTCICPEIQKEKKRTKTEVGIRRHSPQQPSHNSPGIWPFPLQQDLRGLFHGAPAHGGPERHQVQGAGSGVRRGAGFRRTGDCSRREVGVCHWW